MELISEAYGRSTRTDYRLIARPLLREDNATQKSAASNTTTPAFQQYKVVVYYDMTYIFTKIQFLKFERGIHF